MEKKLWKCGMPCRVQDCGRCDLLHDCTYCEHAGSKICDVCRMKGGDAEVATVAELAELKALVNQLYRARELLEVGKTLEDYITELEQAVKAKAASS